VRTRGIETGLDLRAGKAIILQDPSLGTGAAIRRVHVETQVRALVLRLRTLIDVSTLTVPDLSESRRTRQGRAGEAIFEELRVPRTGAFVASEGIDTFVRAIVLIL